MRLPILLVFTVIICNAQNTELKNCDCINAAEISKKTNAEKFGTSGTGKLIEISDANDKSLYYFENEHNTGWYKFSVKTDVELTLEITPDNATDDIDFILFKYDEDGFCDRIRLKKLLPVRSNLARSSNVGSGSTGIKTGATDEFVHSGVGNIFSKTINAKKDEVYYLVIDNVSGSGSYSIMLEDGYKEKKLNSTDAVPITADGYVEIKTPYQLKIVDDASGQPLKGNIDVAGYQIGEPFHADEVSDITINLSSSQTVTLNCTAPGYVFFTKTIIATTVPYNANKTPDVVSYEIRLKKIILGENVTLPNIKFEGDGVGFLPSSRPSLLSLYKFMLDNPTAKIEIGGHVNAPKMKNSGKLKTLSKDRAKAVFNYLIDKGIDASRITFKGYGNSKMVYKSPVNEKQNEENRRVEIKIISI
jgi:outer membrane protein OmpA-like peptidoglycan-associated protein